MPASSAVFMTGAVPAVVRTVVVAGLALLLRAELLIDRSSWGSVLGHLPDATAAAFVLWVPR